MKMNKSELREVIAASKEDTWEVLFNQYGEIHIHNPLMLSSSYMHGSSRGELGCERHCKFDEKLYLNEKITEVDEKNYRLKIVATEHNLPFFKEMSAVYELSSVGTGMTEVKMTSYNTTSPRFMIYLMRGTQVKTLAKHLFGMKYYIETGKTVDNHNYSKIYKNYK